MSAESAKAWRQRQKEKIVRMHQLEHAHVMNEGLLREQRKTIQKLEQVIADAADIAGEMSILFPASHIKTSHKTQSVWEVAQPNKYDFSLPCSLKPMDMTMQIQRLKVMLGRIEKNAMRQAVHFNIEFGDKRWGYAVSEIALRSMPKNIAIRVVTENLGRVIGMEIA